MRFSLLLCTESVSGTFGDMPTALSNVRFQGNPEDNLLAVSSSLFDPKPPSDD